MAEHDLTWTIAEFFDLHLVFPLLEFLSFQKVYEPKELAKTKLEIVSKTNMLDLMAETHKELYKTEPAELAQRRQTVIAKWEQMTEKTQPIVTILEKEEVVNMINSSRDRDARQVLEYLKTQHNFKDDMPELLYQFAKFQYECGSYEATSEYLNFYRYLIPPHHPNHLNAMWGKLASEILLQHWDVAKEDLGKLRSYIDNNPFETELELLQQRAWLIHWNLWIAFNNDKGRDEIIDMCLNNQHYLNVLQVLCPHIIRYLAVAVVTSRKRKQCIKDLLKVITLEAYQYRDPITELLSCLYIDYDFDGAQDKLRQCEKVLQNDFFLTGCCGEFMECARQLIFEMFCRIHQCITIKMLAQKLNMKDEEAERWIVNLIRNAQLDAKIDSKMGHVIMGTRSVSIHEQVMESTKRLSFRAQQMAFQLDKLRTERQTKIRLQEGFKKEHYYTLKGRSQWGKD